MTAVDGALVPDDLRQDYPRFSDSEMVRRKTELLAAAKRDGIDVVLLVGAERAGSAVQWITGWPVTREAVAVVDDTHTDALFVQHYNHVPLARELARSATVTWGGPSTFATVIDELTRRGVKDRVGVIGPVSASAHRALTAAGLEAMSLAATYTRLRLVKSPAEIEWLRVGAALSDAGITAMIDTQLSGRTEWELVDVVERAYVPHGGTTHIHYFGVTSMTEPRRGVPAQYPSYRRIAPGDAVTVELSASFWGYPGQVLRTVAVAEEPSPLYREMHQVAEGAYDAITKVMRHGTTPDEIIAAAGVIEDAGFTTLDDLVHGFGGGYFPPVLGSSSRDHDRSRAIPLQSGMTVVVQPNVITPDGRAGVQTGELLHVRADGVERLHRAPAGFLRAL